MLDIVDYSHVGGDSCNISRSRIYLGEIFCCRNLPEAQIIANNIRQMLCQISHITTEHSDIHQHLSHHEFEQCKQTINKQVQDNQQMKKLLRCMLDKLGWHEKEVCIDSLAIRMNPPIAYAQQSSNIRAMRSYTNFHRDTWGVGIMSQINFWMPIFPLAENNTFAIYPSYWNRPLANTTESWSFSEYVRMWRQGDDSYPFMPQPLEKPDFQQAYPIVIQPHDMLIFSAAHLHGTLPNTSHYTRINFETRCYFAHDEQQKIGAPNIDTYTRKQATHLFSPL